MSTTENEQTLNGESTSQPTEPQPSVQPSSSKASSQLTYDDAFPPIGESAAASAKGGAWTNTAPLMKRIKSKKVTKQMSIPLEERRFRAGLTEFGKGSSNDQGKDQCQKIMRMTGTVIEYSECKDKSIIVMITGEPKNVEIAQSKVMAQLTQQGNIEISIPKDHHRMIIGTGGEKLKELEKRTGTKITVPKQNETSDLVKIEGGKDAMREARREIEELSANQLLKHREEVTIERWIHPFVRGGHDKNIREWRAKYNVKIDIPPPSSENTNIIVRGTSETVLVVVREIKSLAERKASKCTKLEIEVDKKQHKFVFGQRGNGIQDVLSETGVAVEVPPQDSNSNTILLRGEPQEMGAALTMVYANASSVSDSYVEAPEWMHRILIGQRGAAIKELGTKFGADKVQINFKGAKIDPKRPGIGLEGPPDYVEKVKAELERRIAEINATTAHVELVCEPQYHSHLIGKGGANLKKYQEEFKVSVNVPGDRDQIKNIIWIEGPPDGCAKARAELQKMIARFADEVSDMIFVTRRFHRQIIGAGGSNIKTFREKYPNVNISIPDESTRSDQITIRGPTKELKLAKAELEQLGRSLEENGFRIEVPILKEYHRNIIGKEGKTIREIRDQTNCNIELPKEGSDSEIITIIGKKADCELARKKIRAIEKEHVNIVEETVVIETKLHQALIGMGGKGVKKLQGDSAVIHFPSDGSANVTIRGKPEGVVEAKKALNEEAALLRLQSFTATVTASPEYHRFLIGRGGSNMKDLRDKTGCRIAVPGPRDDNKNIITILGTRTGVAEAKAILEKRVTELASIEELTIEVPFIYHKNFTARRAEMINEISDQCGGVQISFPKQSQDGDQSETVTVKGPGKCVREAMGLIKERVEDLEAQITDELDIDREHHRSIIGSGGSQVKEIQADYNVNIRFPLANEADPAIQNIIQISGRKEKVELARARLLSLVPITFEYELEKTYHRDLVGKKGETVRGLMNQYDINISIPKPTADQEEVPDLVTLRGKQEGIDGCCAAIDNLKLKWEDQAADRLAREYTETIEVHPMFHSKIIGQKGARIKALQEEHSGEDGKVQVNFPRSESKNDEAIHIIGYEENVKSMREAIEQIVADLESHVSQDVLIGKKVHPRLIGTRGSGIRKLMKEFGVDIRIGKGADPDRVTCVGPSSKVEECIDHMLNLEEEILQEMAERDEDEVYRPEKRTPFQGGDRHKSSKQGGKGFSVQNAPWDASCDGDFPTLGDGKSNGNSKSAWGPKH